MGRDIHLEVRCEVMQSPLILILEVATGAIALLLHNFAN